MAVGTAISNLIDKPDQKMSFGIEEMNSPEALWYKSLTGVQDRIGSISNLKTSKIDEIKNEKATGSTVSRAKQPMEPKPKVVHIEETENGDEDDGLIPYGKPDSDEEDEDEDPTLVQRNKPTAPVSVAKSLHTMESYSQIS
jgi:telomere length regulation protein